MLALDQDEHSVTVTDQHGTRYTADAVIGVVLFVQKMALS